MTTLPVDVSDLEQAAPAPDADELDDEEYAPAVRAEVLIAGKHVGFTPPAECEHRSVNAEVVSAVLVDDDRPTEIAGRELMVKARCGECGCPFRFDVGTARESRTMGDRGLVATIEPTEE